MKTFGQVCKQWLHNLVAKSGFISQPKLWVLACGNRFRLLEPLAYLAKSGETFVAPTGFETDFASVPRIFQPFFPVDGKYTAAAILHDAGCEHKLNHDITRAQTDALFFEAMRSCGTPWLTAKVMFWGVRIFAIVTGKR